MLCESDGSGNPLDITMDKDCNVQRGSDSERNSHKRKNESWSVAEHQPKGKLNYKRICINKANNP